MELTYWQSNRLIILPQALKISIPGIVNTFIDLYKDTTLVLIIGMLDPLGIAVRRWRIPDFLVIMSLTRVSCLSLKACPLQHRQSAFI